MTFNNSFINNFLFQLVSKFLNKYYQPNKEHKISTTKETPKANKKTAIKYSPVATLFQIPLKMPNLLDTFRFNLRSGCDSSPEACSRSLTRTKWGHNVSQVSECGFWQRIQEIHAAISFCGFNI